MKLTTKKQIDKAVRDRCDPIIKEMLNSTSDGLNADAMESDFRDGVLAGIELIKKINGL